MIEIASPLAACAVLARRAAAIAIAPERAHRAPVAPTGAQVATDRRSRAAAQLAQAWIDGAGAGAQAAGNGGAIAARGRAVRSRSRAGRARCRPPGDYRCRVFKLGAQGPGDAATSPPIPISTAASRARARCCSFYKIDRIAAPGRAGLPRWRRARDLPRHDDARRRDVAAAIRPRRRATWPASSSGSATGAGGWCCPIRASNRCST